MITGCKAAASACTAFSSLRLGAEAELSLLDPAGRLAQRRLDPRHGEAGGLQPACEIVYLPLQAQQLDPGHHPILGERLRDRQLFARQSVRALQLTKARRQLGQFLLSLRRLAAQNFEFRL